MNNGVTLLCLALICVYNYFRASRLHKRISALESSLDEVAKAASSTGTGTGNVYV